MYSEIDERKSSSPRADLLLAALLLVGIVLMRPLMQAIRALPQPYNAISGMLLFAAFAALCFLIYRRRLASYRYSMLVELPPRADEAGGDSLRPPASDAAGTLYFERLGGKKGELLERIAHNELVAILPPGRAPQLAPGDGPAEKPALFSRSLLTCKPRRRAHALLYRRDGKLRCIRFCPSCDLLERIERMISHG